MWDPMAVSLSLTVIFYRLYQLTRVGVETELFRIKPTDNRLVYLQQHAGALKSLLAWWEDGDGG